MIGNHLALISLKILSLHKKKHFENKNKKDIKSFIIRDFRCNATSSITYIKSENS